ncbi:hypothetical protein PHLGIDRAFT_437851 [Phlebiopsis gigantea 11061_1 CR5-6]|uniref:Tubulin-specific chaperone A n=1 Tax=Phlebiopsis gigantea (strain 11061_1 CR5-6) TaxID=745531 RepID=A0A0C3SF97_PHLG1|nr:hypothetical protein PHLGIDRAFT_437851 [Phlebiopsis gigantea 11061_1 CR5-6]
MSDTAAIQRQLRIKTGVAKRLFKEHRSYILEAEQQKIKLDKFVADGAEDWDIKNAKRMLEESHKMVADTANRLGNAVQDLRQLTVRGVSCGFPRALGILTGLRAAFCGEGAESGWRRRDLEGQGGAGRNQHIVTSHARTNTLPSRTSRDFADIHRLTHTRTTCIRNYGREPPSALSRSLVSFNLVNASRMPDHASRSTRSSCSPRPPSSTEASVAVGRPTPRDGGTKPGAGALIADGAIRDWRMCARDDLMAMCTP